jgi:K+/H+ antiporter YhaU regulatory subunit KhtT
MRRFPPPWSVEKIPGGLKVCDADGQSLAYVYSRENPNDAHMAKVLTEDEARRIASNIAKLPTYSAKLEASASVSGLCAS